MNFLTATVYGDNNPVYIPNHIHPQLTPYQGADIDIAEFCAPVVHPKTVKVITKYTKLANDTDPKIHEMWLNSMGKEFGNMAQGEKKTGTPGMNAGVVLIRDQISRIPKNKKITYARLVMDFRPQKADPNRVRMTAGRNLIEYAGNLTTCMTDLTTAKIVCNSVLSTPGAKYGSFDISNMYLHTPLAPKDYEYMRIPIAVLLEHTIEQYNPRLKKKNELVYLECRSCIYGLSQAGALSNKMLKEHLAPDGYFKVAHTPGLWRHV